MRAGPFICFVRQCNTGRATTVPGAYRLSVNLYWVNAAPFQQAPENITKAGPEATSQICRVPDLLLAVTLSRRL